MKKVFALLATLLAGVSLISCSTREGETPAFTARAILGSATLVSSSGEKMLKVGDVIGLKDTVLTGKQSIVDIVYGDIGLFRINENSKVVFQETITAKGDNTKLLLDKGKLFVTIAKMKKGQLTVDTPTLVASVRGTSFVITAGEERSKLDVVIGTIVINPVVDGKKSEEVEQKVTAMQTVYVDTKIAAAAVNEKKEIPVTALQAKELKVIVDEASGINDSVIDKLNNDVKKELKEEVIQLPQAEEPKKLVDKSSSQQLLAKQKKEQELQQKLKQEEEARLAAKQKEDEAKQKQEQEKKAKEKREKASNIPTL